MRTSTLIALSVSTAATLVVAKDEGGGGGALQALLERMQTKKHQNQARAEVRSAPKDFADGPDSFDSHNSTSSARGSNKSHLKSKDSKTKESSSSSESERHSATSTTKLVKSTDRGKHHARPSASSVENSSSTKSRLRSSETRRPVSSSDKKNKNKDLPTSALEKELRYAESDKPLTDDEFDSMTEGEAKTASSDSATATDKSKKKGHEKSFGRKEDLKKHEDKRWVWGTAIIQDDTPAASDVPAVGANANYLNSAPVNTPAATLAAPSFPPLPVVQSSSQTPVVQSSSQTPPASAAATTAARQNIINRKKAAAHPTVAAKEKRWTRGTEIIQDGDANAPPVGENANLLSSGTTIALNTPVASLTPPSFPPLAEPTTSSAPAVGTPVQAVQDQQGGTSNLEALLHKLQDEINALANAYSQATQTTDAVEAAATTSPVENAKRWVWGPSIIQDDTPSSEAPPIGQNTNLFNPSIPVATPSGKPLPPSFPGRVGLATVNSANQLAASPPSQAPVTPPVEPEIETAAEAISTSTTKRNRKSEADSLRSVRAAEAKTKTAALEWHLVNKKRQVGGMAKQHKRA